jgi:hypothetical protein
MWSSIINWLDNFSQKWAWIRFPYAYCHNEAFRRSAEIREEMDEKRKIYEA